VRLACITPIFLLLACIPPEEQTRQQAEVAAERAAWWPIQLADENQCRMQGFQEGTDAFAQCVTTKIDQQSRPHRGAGRGWLILNKY
jgi:hypothetical protein